VAWLLSQTSSTTSLVLVFNIFHHKAKPFLLFLFPRFKRTLISLIFSIILISAPTNRYPRLKNWFHSIVKDLRLLFPPKSPFSANIFSHTSPNSFPFFHFIDFAVNTHNTRSPQTLMLQTTKSLSRDGNR